ncbi:hypothetical protein [Streptomyces mirabilis]|uniref:hypothetical protein n=1 Tax=Streptomyces mirabilis TaxID=68239 RepID=UPI0036BBDD1B
MPNTTAAPASVALWTAYEEHLAACTACPTAPTVRHRGLVTHGNCAEALRLSDAHADMAAEETERAVNRWYPRSRYSEEERNAARSHFAWHDGDCNCGV